MADIGEASHQRITWFYQRSKENSLELAPPFQRKPVWSMKNKSYLIDTIIQGLPIPEIYVQIKTDRDGNTKYIIVDGQQRLRAVLEFLEGEYEISEEDNQTFGGKFFADLPDGIKKEIWNYRFVVRELSTTSDEDIRHIFQRLNKNVVPLNRQELRNATFLGDFIQLATELASDDYWAEQKVVNSSDIRRMIDIEFVSELMVSLIHGIQTKEPDLLDKFYKLYDDNFQQKDDIKNKFLRVKNKIDELIGQELKSTRWHYKLDYYPLFFALSELLESYHFPSDRMDEIGSALSNFSKLVAEEKLENSYVKEYHQAQLTRRSDKENRATRVKAIKSIIIPFLISKDNRRLFTEEERRIFWELSKNKKCALCQLDVKWDEYELDHINPHSKGGKTELKNAQITHKICNASKSDK